MTAVAILLACSGWITDTLLSPHAAIAQSPLDGPILTFDLGGAELRIPRSYFLPAPPREGKTDGLFIIALMPSMAPMREDNKNEFLYPNPKGHGKTVGILMEDARATTGVEFRFNSERNMGKPYDAKPDLYGLKVLLPGETAPNDGRRRQELYFNEQNDKILSYIACYRKGAAAPFPNCAETFVYRTLLVQATYGKGFLPQWKKIERDVAALIDRFSAQPAP